MDTIRVLRVVEFVGPRAQVEAQIRQCIHGEKKFGQMTIRAATIGTYPEILDAANSKAEGLDASSS